MVQHRDCRLRKATDMDATLLEKWLENPKDCKMAIGHAPFVKAEFHDWLQQEDQFGWVIEDSRGPVGYGEIWVDTDAGDLELAHLIVRPDCRGQGYGKVLTELLVKQGRHYGFPFVYLRTYPENNVALKCYESVGFTRVRDLTPAMSPEWVWMSHKYA